MPSIHPLVDLCNAVSRAYAIPIAVFDLVHEAPLPGGSGTWAEKVLVTSAHVARVPDGLAPAAAHAESST